MTQLQLFPPENPLLHLNPNVRITEIGGEIYVSILDIFQYHGNKTNPTLAWQQTLTMLEKQGFEGSMDFIEHKFKGRGQRSTPVVNLKGFLRLSQSTEIKEWEGIRDLQAQTTADDIKAKATRHREHNIQAIDNAGLGETIEARRYKARHENIEAYKLLQAVIAKVCDSPQIGILTNAEYIALFGETTDTLKKLLNTKSIRDSLNVTQLRTLTYAEDTLRDILASKRNISTGEIEQIIYGVLPPIGDMLRSIMNTQGLDHITGKPLLGSGND